MDNSTNCGENILVTMHFNELLCILLSKINTDNIHCIYLYLHILKFSLELNSMNIGLCETRDACIVV